MIESEYYMNYYIGPNLVNVTVGDIDFTDHVNVFYGHDNNWQGKLWTFQDIFPAGYKGMSFTCTFEGHYLKGQIGKNEIFNHPLFIPINQDL